MQSLSCNAIIKNNMQGTGRMQQVATRQPTSQHDMSGIGIIIDGGN